MGGHISISPIRKSQLLKVSFESESPKLAALVANTIPSVYISDHLESKIAITNKAATWLSDRRVILRETLQASEQKLHQFREDNDLVGVSGVAGLVSQELNQLTRQLSEARRNLGQVESIHKVIQQQRSPKNLETLPEVLNHSVIQSIQGVEESASRKVSELARRYGPMHPKMVAT